MIISQNTSIEGATVLKKSHVPELDSFRAIAILSVMCLHWLPEHCLFNRVQGQLSNGVHLFFVLSGYLITRILLDSRSAIDDRVATLPWSLHVFYLRRFLRIFPVYYFILFAGTALHYQGMREGFPWHVTYTSNIYYFRRQAFDGPASLFWTLAVEEQFYLLWPLVILILPRRAIFPTVAAVAVVGTVFRIDAILTDSWSRILLPACSNFLSVGALGAVAENTYSGSEKLRKNLLCVFWILIALSSLAIVVIAAVAGARWFLNSSAMRAITQPMFALLYLCIFSHLANDTTNVKIHQRVLRFGPLVYLGRISYGMYLYHLFISFGLERFTVPLSRSVGMTASLYLTRSFVAKLAATVVIAGLSWQLFESPLNNLKRHFPYRKRRTQMAGIT